MTSVILNISVAALASLLICLCQASANTSAPSHVGGHSLHKRSFAQLCTLISRYTDRYCSDYNYYGCYCGPGGGGHYVDDVDRCCYKHDICYGNVNCHRYWYALWVHYSYECNGNNCYCTNSSFWNPCYRSTCECDVEFVECLQNAQYNNNYRNYRRHCG